MKIHFVGFFIGIKWEKIEIMNIRNIYEWICSAPMLVGEKVNLDYLPANAGWSVTTPRTKTNTDILGNSWESVEVTITRRKSVSGNADRLNLLDEMDALRVWAKENPPDGGRVVPAGISKPKSRSAAGTEDFALTLRVEEG